MTAEIRKIDRNRRRVFGFAATDVDELRWYEAVLKTCDQPTCDVRDGDLIELSYLTREKQRYLGVELQGAPIWIGLQIRNEKVWKAIESGKIQTFEVDIDGGGVRIDFPEQKGGKKMPIVGKCFEFTKESALQPDDHDLVTRCARAVADGDLGNLTKTDFENALNALAAALAIERKTSFHRAYGAITATLLGGELLQGHAEAPMGKSAPINKADDPSSPPSWCEIEKRAKELRERQPQLTEAVAISKAIDADPQLYVDYIAETSMP